MIELRDDNGRYFAVGETELDAWINLLHRRGRCTDFSVFLDAVIVLKGMGVKVVRVG